MIDAQTVIFNNGYYATTFGDDPNNPLMTISSLALYLEVEVDSAGPLAPRQELASTLAKMANVTERLEGGPVDGNPNKCRGALIGRNGSWVGPTLSLGQ